MSEANLQGTMKYQAYLTVQAYKFGDITEVLKKLK